MTVLTKELNGIFLIGINRANKKNCVNHEVAVGLLKAFESFNANPKYKVAILYGEGGTFCAGYDLQEVSEGRHMEKGHEFVDFIQKNRFLVNFLKIPVSKAAQQNKSRVLNFCHFKETVLEGPTNLKIDKPIIAAVEGYAVAGGFELTLMADLRVVAEDAIMGVFCRRVGVPLIDGGTVRLPKIIGLGRALDIILTGRDVYAKEAKEIGLATLISPKGQALNKAIDLARLIMKHPEACMLTDRQSVFNSLQCSHDDAMTFEYEKGQEVLVEAIEGAKKFTKRSRSKL